jgi:HlyD family secretion protein
MNTRLVTGVAGVAAVTAVLAFYYRSNASADVPRYLTVAASRGSVVDTVEATGTLQAVTTVQVGSQVSGTIQSLHADFNSQVHKGDVIARLDASLLQAQVDQASATVIRLEADVERAGVTLDDAETKLARARQLHDAGLIPMVDLETAESTARQAAASVKAAQAQVIQARAALVQNQVNVRHTVITAPVDGIVISRNVDVGQTVAASMSAPTLFVIAKDLGRMQVEASIDESDIGRIAAGQTVAFEVDAYPRRRFTGVVSQVRLQPVVAQNVVSYVTVIDVPNPEHLLKPGMTANVTIEIARADDVITVPNAALRFRPPDAEPSPAPAQARSAWPEQGRRPGWRAAVWVLRNGQLREVAVETGISNGVETAITGGELAENAPVVTGLQASAASPPAPTASPLIPQRPGGNRQGAGGAANRGAGR